MIRISWGWAPFIAIGMAAVANTGLILAVGRVRPQAVTDRPYLDSFGQDELDAARGRFAAQGLRLAAETSADGVVVIVQGPASALRDVAIECYRPADRQLDHRVTWSEPGAPLRIQLPARGRWQLRLVGTLDGKTVQAETDASSG